MIDVYKMDYVTPLGILEMMSTEDAVTSILFCDRDQPLVHKNEIPKVLRECYTQIEEYFKGSRKDFTFRYKMEGTPFQQTVWKELANVPYGSSVSYQSIANALGKPKANRAVGNANGKNKISIVIPCHRIIGSDGSLTGYAGELWRKEWLLEHEKKFK
jgi:methylated-DNA-[protein]-cysteine S-methyltransferase